MVAPMYSLPVDIVERAAVLEFGDLTIRKSYNAFLLVYGDDVSLDVTDLDELKL
jgi:hypothetical protein